MRRVDVWSVLREVDVSVVIRVSCVEFCEKRVSRFEIDVVLLMGWVLCLLASRYVPPCRETQSVQRGLARFVPLPPLVDAGRNNRTKARLGLPNDISVKWRSPKFSESLVTFH